MVPMCVCVCVCTHANKVGRGEGAWPVELQDVLFMSSSYCCSSARFRDTVATDNHVTKGHAPWYMRETGNSREWDLVCLPTVCVCLCVCVCVCVCVQVYVDMFV